MRASISQPQQNNTRRSEDLAYWMMRGLIGRDGQLELLPLLALLSSICYRLFVRVQVLAGPYTLFATTFSFPSSMARSTAFSKPRNPPAVAQLHDASVAPKCIVTLNLSSNVMLSTLVLID